VRNLNVLISGAGIAGPCLAYWLLREGMTPTIVESAPAARTGGYMIDFWGVGYDVAERMGLLPALRVDGYPLEEIRLVNSAGRTVGGFDAGVFAAAAGGRYTSLLRGDLAHRIYELVADRTELIFSDSIAALDEDLSGVGVRFESAPPRRFDLVIGADGLHSRVRSLVFGREEGYLKHLGYYTAAFTVNGYPHRDEGVYVSYAVPGRQVARYALRDGRSAFFFIFASEGPRPGEPRDMGSQREALRSAFAGAGWECDEILEAMDRSEDLYFDAVAQIRMPSWHRGRVALLGDAAYCPSLLAGQGSAFAMAGAYILARSLASTAGDYAAAFEEYQRSFKPFIDRKQRAAERFGGWFAPRTRFGIRLRNLTTKLLRLPYVADLTVGRSVADHFELPA
jgi:2-polyprenyl-6-methoxyphenol hydroxylase-like FAD-dependent oxidoreductase